IVDAQRAGDVLLEGSEQAAAGEAFGGLAHLIKALFQVGHFGLAQRLLKLALKFGGHLARLADPLPHGAQDPRQLLRADGHQRDNRDEEKFTPADVEHQTFRSRETVLSRDLKDKGAARVVLSVLKTS